MHPVLCRIVSTRPFSMLSCFAECMVYKVCAVRRNESVCVLFSVFMKTLFPCFFDRDGQWMLIVLLLVNKSMPIMIQCICVHSLSWAVTTVSGDINSLLAHNYTHQLNLLCIEHDSICFIQSPRIFWLKYMAKPSVSLPNTSRSSFSGANREHYSTNRWILHPPTL